MWSEAVDTTISQALEKHMDCILIGSILNVVVAIVAVVIPFTDVIIVGMSVVSTMVQIIFTCSACQKSFLQMAFYSVRID